MRKDIIETDVKVKVYDCITPQKTTFEVKKNAKIHESHIILIKDGEELLKNTDWLFDPHSMILTIMEADDNATYCALIYINNNLFTENIINDIEESK